MSQRIYVPRARLGYPGVALSHWRHNNSLSESHGLSAILRPMGAPLLVAASFCFDRYAYERFDVCIVGDDPLLASLVALAAARDSLRTLIIPDACRDLSAPIARAHALRRSYYPDAIRIYLEGHLGQSLPADLPDAVAMISSLASNLGEVYIGSSTRLFPSKCGKGERFWAEHHVYNDQRDELDYALQKALRRFSLRPKVGLIEGQQQFCMDIESFVFLSRTSHSVPAEVGRSVRLGSAAHETEQLKTLTPGHRMLDVLAALTAPEELRGGNYTAKIESTWRSL